MNTKLIVWISGILIGAVALAIFWYVAFVPQTEPQVSGQPPTLPIGVPITSPPPSSTSSPAVNTMTLLVQRGSTVVARDFIRNGTTVSDEANPGRYMVAGNLGYCLSDPQKCQAAPADNFNIYYNSVPQSFTIALTEEPIGQARLAMERFLLATLGLTEEQMCSLNYYVGTTIYVNAQYAGNNLGFSFCPGATILPQ